MIDLHSHVLPGLDDGPSGVAEALSLARAALDSGTRRLAATPHVDRHYGLEPLAIAIALERFRAALEEEQVELEVLSGAEIALDRLVDLTAAERARLGLGGGPCLLVECPLSSIPGEFEWPIRRLLADGAPVLLAHPERCPGFQREPHRLHALVEAGAMVQLTAGSVRGDFGEPPRRFAIELAGAGLVHNLASDAHDLGARPPGLAAVATLAGLLAGGRPEAEWLVSGAPAAILAGQPLPPRPY